MGKKKEKKVSLKKLRYAKFKKEKSAQLDLNYPDLSDEQVKERRSDESRIERQLRNIKNKPPHEVVPRREVDKR